ALIPEPKYCRRGQWVPPQWWWIPLPNQFLSRKVPSMKFKGFSEVGLGFMHFYEIGSGLLIDCNGLNFFFNISGTLKGLANKFGLAVVVTNQVVDFIGPHDKVNGVRLGNLESLDTSGRRVSPALGLAWAHCINSRVFLARHEQSIEVNIRNAPSTSICSQTHRTFHLVFAHIWPMHRPNL
ncbi:Putative disease resistance TIR-NBS-LRR class protein, partial [Prunus dulcis]